MDVSAFFAITAIVFGIKACVCCSDTDRWGIFTALSISFGVSAFLWRIL